MLKLKNTVMEYMEVNLVLTHIICLTNQHLQQHSNSVHLNCWSKLTVILHYFLTYTTDFLNECLQPNIRYQEMIEWITSKSDEGKIYNPCPALFPTPNSMFYTDVSPVISIINVTDVSKSKSPVCLNYCSGTFVVVHFTLKLCHEVAWLLPFMTNWKLDHEVPWLCYFMV